MHASVKGLRSIVFEGKAVMAACKATSDRKAPRFNRLLVRLAKKS